MFQFLTIALLVNSAATSILNGPQLANASSSTRVKRFKQIPPGDCLTFPTEHMRKRHEVTNYFLTGSVAQEVSEQAFADFPLATLNAVWRGSTSLQWRNATRFSTCRTIVSELYEVFNFKLNFKLLTKFMGQYCRVHFDKRTQEYVEELTVCKENSRFIYTHVCKDCRTYLHVRRWATNRFLPDYNYVVMGPVAYYFYGTHHASHSRTLVAFVITDNAYFYANARLIFYGNSGNIYKLDLSENDLYNKGHNRGLFDPDYPPGFENVTPYVPIPIENK